MQEPAGLEGTVAAHNAARAAVGVGPLRWEPALAAIAEAWVRQCRDRAPPPPDQPDGLVDHNPDRSAGYPSYVGENIYGSTGPTTGAAAVASWLREQSYYHHDSNSCDAPPPRSCGHYTQVVWRATTAVGCALYRCPGLTYAYTVVCDYGPGGNLNEQSPY